MGQVVIMPCNLYISVTLNVALICSLMWNEVDLLLDILMSS